MNPDLALALEFLKGNGQPLALTASPLQQVLKGEILEIDPTLGSALLAFEPGAEFIQGNGVIPNIRVAMTAEEERSLFALRNAGNIKSEDEKNIVKSKDPQMRRAIDALKGVMIYAQENAPKAEAVKK